MTGKASEPAAGFQNRFRSVPRTGWPFPLATSWCVKPP